MTSLFDVICENAPTPKKKKSERSIIFVCQTRKNILIGKNKEETSYTYLSKIKPYQPKIFKLARKIR